MWGKQTIRKPQLPPSHIPIFYSIDQAKIAAPVCLYGSAHLPLRDAAQLPRVSLARDSASASRFNNRSN